MRRCDTSYIWPEKGPQSKSLEIIGLFFTVIICVINELFLSHSPIWKLQQEPIAFRDQPVIILHREKQKEAFNHFLFSKSLWKEVTTIWSNWLFKLHPSAWLRLGRCFGATSYSLCRCHFAYSNCNILLYCTHTWTPQSHVHHS